MICGPVLFYGSVDLDCMEGEDGPSWLNIAITREVRKILSSQMKLSSTGSPKVQE